VSDPRNQTGRVDLAMALLHTGIAMESPADQTESLGMSQRAAGILDEIVKQGAGGRRAVTLAMANDFVGRRLETMGDARGHAVLRKTGGSIPGGKPGE
jgi:hypothetical protein